MTHDATPIPAPSASPTVRIENLKVSFGARQAVAIGKLEFARGQLSVLLGRSGSGKTTLLRSINRLNECFDGCTTTGAVRVLLGDAWHDVHANTLPLEELRRRVGMVFQAPNVLPTSIERNMTLPLKLSLDIRGSQAQARMQTALTEAGLWAEVRDRLPHDARTLSGGQQQRLCLARAMALEPEILLLDEPSASLDFQATRRIEELLLELKDRYTLIVVSHSLGQARRLAQRLIVFKDATLARELDSHSIADDAAFQKVVEELF